MLCITIRGGEAVLKQDRLISDLEGPEEKDMFFSKFSSSSFSSKIDQGRRRRHQQQKTGANRSMQMPVEKTHRELG